MHQEVISAVGQLCSDTVAQYEAGFKAQVGSDKAVIEVENVRKVRAAEQAAKLAAEEAAKLATEHAMADFPPYSKKEAVSGPQDAGYKDYGDDNDDCEEEEEDRNNSAADEVRIQ
jgi:hypothetical protein